MGVESVTTSALIANLPTRWDKLRAAAKIVATAMTSRRDRVVTLSSDGKHVELVDADKFNAEQFASEHPTEAAE
jgi:hypothetical protein